MSDYARGETVYIRDFPLGKPSKIMGIIVGQRNDYYFVLIKNGLEEGKNKGGDVDSYNRYIYIHGTPHCNSLGSKQSQGCIRMSDRDVIKLFDLVDQKTLVLID